MQYSRFVVCSMLLAIALLVIQAPVTAQDRAEVTRSRVEVSAAVSSLDRAQEERNKALVRRVYDDILRARQYRFGE